LGLSRENVHTTNKSRLVTNRIVANVGYLPEIVGLCPHPSAVCVSVRAQPSQTPHSAHEAGSKRHYNIHCNLTLALSGHIFKRRYNTAFILERWGIAGSRHCTTGRGRRKMRQGSRFACTRTSHCTIEKRGNIGIEWSGGVYFDRQYHLLTGMRELIYCRTHGVTWPLCFRARSCGTVAHMYVNIDVL
jgi:hypothetical protein